MRIDTRLCSHCGSGIIRRDDERPSAYARRIFCGLKCLGQSQAARRLERFYANIDKRGPDECWPWLGRRTEKGYGQFSTSDRNYRAHRLALEFSGVAVPPDLLVMHSCDNPPCCNPKHLSVGTKADNNRDMRLKGRDRQLFGPANHNTKLTAEAKAAIITRRGEPLGPLANEFGVSKATVCRVQKAALCA